ncbi:MAG: hypothetical protein IT572_08110 [Deltaproteobacteria bacterium]|nr:hypothetical protein [Deltaproteobacteria bacterium]
MDLLRLHSSLQSIEMFNKPVRPGGKGSRLLTCDEACRTAEFFRSQWRELRATVTYVESFGSALFGGSGWRLADYYASFQAELER